MEITSPLLGDGNVFYGIVVEKEGKLLLHLLAKLATAVPFCWCCSENKTICSNIILETNPCFPRKIYSAS